jgi:DNA adenine methylase
MTSPRRPALRWHGGKWRLAPWIISHFPSHRIYVEPFGGAASILLRKTRSYAEIYNDLDNEAVNLFRVLRDPVAASKLLNLLYLTPFSRVEFVAAAEPSDDPIEQARRLIVRSFMGFGSNSSSRSVLANYAATGFRANSNRSGTIPAHDWKNYPDALPSIIDRLRGVVIESRDAWEVMTAHDGLTTLHYVDPPYLPETRGQTAMGTTKHQYRYEMTTESHIKLLNRLMTLKGMVILSGYPSPIYDSLLSDWRRVEILALADGARPRTECLWLNKKCASALDGEWWKTETAYDAQADLGGSIDLGLKTIRLRAVAGGEPWERKAHD